MWSRFLTGYHDLFIDAASSIRYPRAVYGLGLLTFPYQNYAMKVKLSAVKHPFSVIAFHS
jgi:hypothetical protein